jgi:hypothetical protein
MNTYIFNEDQAVLVCHLENRVYICILREYENILIRRKVYRFGSMFMTLFIRIIIRTFQFFFQPEQCFSFTTNQPTIFFSRLINTAERDLYTYLTRDYISSIYLS